MNRPKKSLNGLYREQIKKTSAKNEDRISKNSGGRGGRGGKKEHCHYFIAFSKFGGENINLQGRGRGTRVGNQCNRTSAPGWGDKGKIPDERERCAGDLAFRLSKKTREGEGCRIGTATGRKQQGG